MYVFHRDEGRDYSETVVDCSATVVTLVCIGISIIDMIVVVVVVVAVVVLLEVLVAWLSVGRGGVVPV